MQKSHEIFRKQLVLAFMCPATELSANVTTIIEFLIEIAMATNTQSTKEIKLFLSACENALRDVCICKKIKNINGHLFKSVG